MADPTAFVARPEHYGEAGPQFEAAHSDHLPVLVDYAIIPDNLQGARGRPEDSPNR